ncbi:MAG: Rieske 2Fe-2S domain-containing protein, partial [Candidatus Dormibacteria bacterium]
LLHGSRGLGHPLHPALTDLPLGAWGAGAALDYAAHFDPRLGTQAGDVALAVGLLVGVAAAATGLTDSQDTYGQELRVNMLHGLTMAGALALMAASLGLRWWGSFAWHPLALGLSTAGLAVAMAGMYAGGHLTFGLGTMVNRTAFLSGPAGFTRLGSSTDFPEGQLRQADAGGMQVVVARVQGQLCALSAVCSHAGGPLAEGTLAGSVVTCPWHGSRFDLRDGKVLRGPATFPQPQLVVREHDGIVEGRLAHPVP